MATEYRIRLVLHSTMLWCTRRHGNRAYPLIEAASNGILGNPGTSYPGSIPARGHETGGANGDSYIISGNTLEVKQNVTQPGDWIRVVTAPVPVPSAVLLFGTGLVGLIAFRGIQRSKNS